MYTSSYKSVGGDGRGGEASDGCHHGSHGNNQTGESCRRKHSWISWMKRMCNTVNSFLVGLPITLRALWKLTAEHRRRATAVKCATCVTLWWYFTSKWRVINKCWGVRDSGELCCVWSEKVTVTECWHSIWNDHPGSTKMSINMGCVPHWWSKGGKKEGIERPVDPNNKKHFLTYCHMQRLQRFPPPPQQNDKIYFSFRELILI